MPLFILLRNFSIFFLALFSLLACENSSSGDANSGTLSIDITDAAVDSVDKVYVEFHGITVKPKEGEQQRFALIGDSQSCKNLLDGIAAQTTEEGEQTIRCIELKALQGTKSTDLIDDIKLSAGHYNWMRLDVAAEKSVMDSIVVLKNGAQESLYIPSGSKSGLKIHSGFTILAGGDHDFVIDFDLRKSVNNPKGFADYRLKPSLRLIDLSASGNIVGTVATDLLSADSCTADINTGDGFAVYVYQGADAIIGEEGSVDAPYTSASLRLNDDGQWQYTVGFLAAGEYTLAFTCQAADDSSESASDDISFVESIDNPVTVLAGQNSTLNFE